MTEWLSELLQHWANFTTLWHYTLVLPYLHTRTYCRLLAFSDDDDDEEDEEDEPVCSVLDSLPVSFGFNFALKGLLYLTGR